MLNAFRFTGYKLFYSGLLKYHSDDRLRLLYLSSPSSLTFFNTVSLLRPEYRYYKNGILINPSNYMTNYSSESPPVLPSLSQSQADSHRQADSGRRGKREESKSNPGSSKSHSASEKSEKSEESELDE